MANKTQPSKESVEDYLNAVLNLAKKRGLFSTSSFH
jgi:hypothetical protein